MLVWLAVIALIFLLYAFGVLLMMLATVLHVGKERWEEAGRISGSVRKAFMGEVDPEPGGVRDIRVTRGRVWDRKKRRYLRQGKLTDDYVRGLVS